MINQVKHKLILLTIFLITGCNSLPFNSSDDGDSESKEVCASKPPTELVLKDVTEITLKSSLAKIIVMLQQITSLFNSAVVVSKAFPNLSELFESIKGYGLNKTLSSTAPTSTASNASKATTSTTKK